MAEQRKRHRQLKLFAVTAALGLIAQYNHVHIPHTEALIDGRWAFGFIGIALLRHGWAALVLAAVLSLPFGSDVPFLTGFAGNMLYAVPALLLIRPVHRRLLARFGPGWPYGLGWALLVLFCYQVFITPMVWAVLAVLRDAPLWAMILDGWRTQPFLIESILVALFSAVAMVAVLAHKRLRDNQTRLDHMNRVLLGIRNVSQLIVSESDPVRLIKRACTSLTRHMGYWNAWVALLDEADGSVSATAEAGFERGFAALRQQMTRGQLPQCMQRALQQTPLVIVKTPETECGGCPLSTEYGSCAALSRRLAYQGTTYGVLAVSVPASYADDEEEHAFFNELANDLAFALHEIHTAKQLRESKQRYRQLFEGGRDGFVMVDPAGRILDANQAYCEMLGYSLEELRALPDFYAVTPERWREWEATEIWEQRLLVQGYSGLYEKEYVRKDGTVFPVELRSYAVRREDGELDYLWGAVRDITKRKQAEEARRREHAQLEFVVAGSGLGTWVWNIQTNETIFNERWARMVGYSLDELAPCNLDTWVRLVHPEDIEETRERLRLCIAGQTAEYSCEMRMRHKAGHWVWILDRGRVMTWDNEGKPLSMFGTHTDITELKRATDELRARERFLQALLETTAEGFWVLDMQGRVTEANSTYCALSGYRRDEVVGVGIGDLDADESPEETRARIQRIMANGSELFEARHRRKDGSLLPLEISATYVEEEGGRFVCFCRDLTERKRGEQQIALLGQMLDAAPASITIHDTGGRFLFANEATLALHGYTDLEEFLAVNLHDLDVPESAERIAERMRRIEEHGEARFEVMHYRKDGSTFPLEILAKYIDWQGRPALLSVATDITERTQAETQLRERTGLLQNITNHMFDMVAMTDLTGLFTYAGPSHRILGFEPEQLLGTSVFDYVHPDDAAYIAREFNAFITHPTPETTRTVEYRQRCKDGSYLWLETMGKVLFSQGGAPSSLFFSSRDITERKRVEQALRESEERIQSIFRSAPIGIGVVVNRFLKQVNPQFCQITGYAAGELVDQSARMLYPSDTDYEYVGQEKYAQIQRNGTGTVETRWKRKDGVIINVLLSSTPIDLNDLSKGVTFAALDFTDRKKAEDEREMLREQLTQAQKMESVGRLAGGVAHDFNNMLNVILGHTELALDAVPADEALHEDLVEVRRAAERSADLTRQLLAFARKQTVAPRVLDVNETVESMLKMLSRLIGEDIELRWMPRPSLAPVRMDPAQIDQVLANLLVNARDAIGREAGTVVIETAMAEFDADYCASRPGFAPGHYVMLAVSDNGCGMDAATREQVFEPFFTTKGVGEGTGLGLATVYGIIRQNEGHVNVYSEPGQGTVFRVYLPAHGERPGLAEGATRAEAPQSKGGETILLVEDEPSLLDLTDKMLQRLGYHTLTASTPGEAIRLAREHAGEIHLLITDVVMPEMNGRDLAKNLLSLYPDLKRLFMSGYTADVIAHQGVLDPGVNFIQKPFSKNGLGVKVREALES